MWLIGWQRCNINFINVSPHQPPSSPCVVLEFDAETLCRMVDPTRSCWNGTGSISKGMTTDDVCVRMWWRWLIDGVVLYWFPKPMMWRFYWCLFIFLGGRRMTVVSAGLVLRLEGLLRRRLLLLPPNCCFKRKWLSLRYKQFWPTILNSDNLFDVSLNLMKRKLRRIAGGLRGEEGWMGKKLSGQTIFLLVTSNK